MEIVLPINLRWVVIVPIRGLVSIHFRSWMTVITYPIPRPFPKAKLRVDQPSSPPRILCEMKRCVKRNGLLNQQQRHYHHLVTRDTAIIFNKMIQVSPKTVVPPLVISTILVPFLRRQPHQIPILFWNLVWTISTIARTGITLASVERSITGLQLLRLGIRVICIVGSRLTMLEEEEKEVIEVLASKTMKMNAYEQDFAAKNCNPPTQCWQAIVSSRNPPAQEVLLIGDFVQESRRLRGPYHHRRRRRSWWEKNWCYYAFVSLWSYPYHLLKLRYVPLWISKNIPWRSLKT